MSLSTDKKGNVNRMMRITGIAMLLWLAACSEKTPTTSDAGSATSKMVPASNVPSGASGITAASGAIAIFGVASMSEVAAAVSLRLKEEAKKCDEATSPANGKCPAPTSRPWWKCDGWTPENPPAPTPDQSQRLLKFAVGIFSPVVPGDYGSPIPRRVLLMRFGKPVSTSSSERAAYDPGDPMEMVTKWEYPEFRITTVASKPKPDELSIDEGEIFGADVPLLYGVGIGQPIDRWIQQFGSPACSGNSGATAGEYGLSYESEGTDFIPCAEGSCFVTYSIRLILDDSGKVKRMHWSYPML